MYGPDRVDNPNAGLLLNRNLSVLLIIVLKKVEIQSHPKTILLTLFLKQISKKLQF